MFAPDEGSGIPGSSGPLQPGAGLPGIPGDGPSSGATPAPTPATPTGGVGTPPPPPVFSKPQSAAPAPGEPATYELASWGRRVGATLIDSFILMVAFIMLFVIPIVALGIVADGGGSDLELSDGASAGAIVVLVLLVIVAIVGLFMYAPITMARNNGATPGKAMVGIRVVRENGAPISLTYAMFREIVIKALLVGGISQFTIGLAYFIDVLWPLWDDQKRALHDMAAKSRVVRG